MTNLPTVAALLANPALFHSLEQHTLERLALQYPYFANVQLLLAKLYQLEQSPMADLQLQKAALYSNDRKQLYELMQLEIPQLAATIRANAAAEQPIPEEETSITSPEKASPVADFTLIEKVETVVQEAEPAPYVLATLDVSTPVTASSTIQTASSEEIVKAESVIAIQETAPIPEPVAGTIATSPEVEVEESTAGEHAPEVNMVEVTADTNSTATPEPESETNHTNTEITKPSKTITPELGDALPTFIRRHSSNRWKEGEPDELDQLIQSARLLASLEQEYTFEEEQPDTDSKVSSEIVSLPAPETTKKETETASVMSESTASLSFIDWLKKHNQGSTVGKVPPSMNDRANHPTAVKNAIQDFAGSFSEQEAEIDNLQVDLQEIASYGMQVHEEFITETMARIYIQQEKFDKAIAVYEKLSLLKPEKSAFFASLIEKIKNDIK